MDEFECGEVIVDLPQQVGQREQNDECDTESSSAGEDDAALWREKQADQQRDEEDNHRRLVLDPNTSGETEDDPPASHRSLAWCAAHQHEHGEDR